MLDDAVINPAFKMISNIRPGVIFTVASLVIATILAKVPAPDLRRPGTLLFRPRSNSAASDPHQWKPLDSCFCRCEEQVYYIFNSLPTARSGRSDVVHDIKNLFRALLPDKSVEEWNFVTRAGLRQTNGVDCGVAAIISALYIVAGFLPPERVDWGTWRLLACRDGGIIADMLLTGREFL